MRGSVWTIGGFGLKQTLALGGNLLLAWYLAPGVFGVMAIVYAVMQGIEMFSDLGVKSSIVRSPRGDDPVYLGTAFSIQAIRGVGLWLVACTLAYPLSQWFGRNDPAANVLLYLLPVIGFSAVLRGLASTALATLSRHMRFGRATVLEIGAQIAALSVMVLWASISPSVWAFAAGSLAGAAFTLITSHTLAGTRGVRPRWNPDCAREMVRFGKWIFLSTVLTFLATEADKLMLGSLLTLAELGVYLIAYKFVKTALSIALRLGDSVLFPAFSRFQNDPARMVRAALRAREMILWASLAACAAIAVAGPLFFEVALDERYTGAGEVARWMVILVWAMILLLTIDRVPLALGNSKALFIANVVRCGGLLVAGVAYQYFGVTGFIVGLAAGPVAAQFSILRQIPHDRARIVLQGLWFTLALAAYTGFALAVLPPIPEEGPDLALGLMTLGLAAAPGLVAGWRVWRGAFVAREGGAVEDRSGNVVCAR